ncbi:hypothetical protein FGSG_12447 [Fusarium graminearum PH-1]|uniref:hypothetical protein n=1 Tax=Gibberella zeae (strain ATCC MYA-4620 / CBS 123657 / FGSC 9075 / NRRL 31084 / PH-1) TaxID=229533 RepID=UPI00021F175B|nr:hypothetical protein FGSG_12447 [Fusarium graminearum PH-1]ESU09854.1 hypothetical protein FGSG_12447 [Fusarium graminearum PH-1]|eukprot:XP_011322353.1 hypothetical protein FGSG_12447 [Fusarium graminearum PH-1]
MGLLKNLPERDAQDLFKRIRSGADAGSVLQQANAGDVMLQMAVVPETRYRYEFPYRSDMPKDFHVDNPYLNSLIYQTATLYSYENGPELTSPSGFTDLVSEEQRSMYLKPFHAAQVIEPLLNDAKISSWTSVSKDDVLMRDLLRVMFRCEYQFTAAFQKDLFLQDLVAGREDFCSPLLVNAVLAYACVCYPQMSNRVEYWNPNNLLYRFTAEAKRLWELEAKVPRITTIQAGIIFTVFHNLCGVDEIGKPYRLQAVALAHQLRIFDTAVADRGERLQRGREYTAWAMYNWETKLVSWSARISNTEENSSPRTPTTSPLLDTVSTRESSPHHMVSNAKKNMHTLVRLYFLRHGFEAMDLFIVVPLVMIGFESANLINNDTPADEIESLRATLILVAQGLYYQRRNHYLAQVLFRVIRGKMRQQEIGLLERSMALRLGDVDRDSELAVAVRSQWPVTTVKKQDEIESRVLSNIVESFGDMSVEGEK